MLVLQFMSTMTFYPHPLLQGLLPAPSSIQLSPSSFPVQGILQFSIPTFFLHLLIRTLVPIPSFIIMDIWNKRLLALFNH